jgi:hypothetical protein
MTGCLDMVNWGDPAEAQPGGEDSTAGEVIVEDAENVTRTVSHDVSSSTVRTRYDAQNEYVEVELTEDIESDYMLVDFGGDATARARLNEKGDRAVIGTDGLYVGGEAEDRTRDLYREGSFEGGPGGFAGVSYGDEVTVTASVVEDGATETVYEETQVLGHGEVNAQVDYLFDSTENAVRVVLASNENADHVDVEFSMGGTIAEARLHEPGDEVRLYANRPKLETIGAAEDLTTRNLSEAVERYDEYKNTDFNLSEIADEAGGVFEDVDDYDDIQGEINQLTDQIEPLSQKAANGQLSESESEELDRLRDDRSRLLQARQELLISESGSTSLQELKRVYLEYAGQVKETDDIDDFDSVLDDDIFDEDFLSARGNFIEDPDVDVQRQYDRPDRDEILDITAEAKIASSETASGIRQRGGTKTTVLDVSGAIRSDGYVELGEEVQTETIELPSNGGSETDEETEMTGADIDAEAVAERLHDSLKEMRQNGQDGFYSAELEETYQLTSSAQQHSETLLNNINEEAELRSIRSGEVPAQPSERNTIQRHMRSGATACHTGNPSSPALYTEGSYVSLTEDVEGTIERAGTTSTRINAEGMAPITVPNYALPLYEAYVYDAWSGEDNVAAFVLDDLVDGDATETEVAEAIADRWSERDGFVESTTNSEHRYQGVGVAVDEETGVIYVTQSLC